MNRLLVEHPDRLARFGAGLIEQLLAGFGVTVVAPGSRRTSRRSPNWCGNMPAIVTSFAGRLYGQRPAKARWLRAVVAADTWTGDAA